MPLAHQELADLSCGTDHDLAHQGQRVSAGGVYARSTTSDDDRFTDYYGCTDVAVTSGGTADSGMFETNLKDERFLLFEGQGAISTWNLSLPAELPAFDYTTISDVILHIRYTAREAGDPLGAQATKELLSQLNTAGQSGQALLFCLRYDFPTEWAAFVNAGADFTFILERQYFPYAVQGATVAIDAITLYTQQGENVAPVTPAGYTTQAELQTASTALNAGQVSLTFPADPDVLVADQARQVFLVLQYHFGTP